jgi:UDP-2,4-diacetamido-2,4,6-trideoxy-beta-L-altropyranose hydrolase
MNTKFHFRLDASAIIGLGHLYRCLALADYAVTHNIQSFFYIRTTTNNNFDLIQKHNHSLVFLSESNQLSKIDLADENHSLTDWLGATQKEDSEEFLLKSLPLRKNCSQNIIIVDHYGIEPTWEKSVCKHFDCYIKLCDSPEKSIGTIADIIIDQTAGRQTIDYSSIGFSNPCILAGQDFVLLSPKYISLNEAEFSHKLSTECKLKILVSFGGTDPLNLNSRFLKLVANENPTFEYIVATGSSNAHLNNLKQTISHLTQKNISIQLMINGDMPNLLSSCHTAVGAAGNSSWERAYLGVPSIVVPFEENQKDIAHFLQSNECAISVDLSNFNEIKRQFNYLSKDQHLRKRFTENSMKLIDGRGCERIIQSIKETVNEL